MPFGSSVEVLLICVLLLIIVEAGAVSVFAISFIWLVDDSPCCCCCCVRFDSCCVGSAAPGCCLGIRRGVCSDDIIRFLHRVSIQVIYVILYSRTSYVVAYGSCIVMLFG